MRITLNIELVTKTRERNKMNRSAFNRELVARREKRPVKTIDHQSFGSGQMTPNVAAKVVMQECNAR